MKRILLLTAFLSGFFVSCKKDAPQEVYKSQERIITSFSIPEAQVGDVHVITGKDTSVIKIKVKKGTNLSAVAPVIQVSKGATVTPASGEPVDFASNNNSYTYVVTSESGVSMKWKVEIAEYTNTRLGLIPNTGDWASNVQVYRDSAYNDFLTRYSGWNGGDGCISILLPNGNLVWSFQDSFFGTIESDRNRDPAKNVFVRNAGFMQEGQSLQSYVQLNPVGFDGKAKTWITVPGAADGNADLYWGGPAQVVGNEVQMVLGHMHDTGSGLAHVSTDVAVFSLPDMKLKTVVTNKYIGALSFDSGIFKASDGYTYMYATESFGICASHLYAARVANHDLTGTWEYYTKSGWMDTPPSDHANYVDLAESNATQPYVFEDGGKYYLVSQTTCYGHDIDIWESNSPAGPFTNRRTLYRIPDNDKVVTYNATVHPGLSREGELVISYNINPLNFADNFNAPGSADLYRPYFVRVFNWK